MSAPTENLIAVDIGNSRVKLGRFDRSADCERAALGGVLPIAGPALWEPAETLAVVPPLGEDSAARRRTSEWLTANAPSGSQVVLASVNRTVEPQLRAIASAWDCVKLENAALPIEIRVDEPQRVGIDRLLAAIAACRLRQPGRPAVVVDLGTAITVDLVATDGAFEGGAILPGIAMAARALSEQTDALPRSPLTELDASPPAVGKSTDQAIDAGLFWGAVGAVRELIARHSDRLTSPPQVFLTGGAAPSVARLLGGPEHAVRYVPHLVLSGIAVVASRLETDR